ncbi:MAG: YicC/YloC family endoribonuclease [Alphaproteobacteria bacterium]
MISSMTGFARVEGHSGDVSWAWEARSVNGRSLDVRVRAPSFVDQAERKTREVLVKYFKRGTIQVALSVEQTESVSRPTINFDVLSGLISDLSKVELPEKAPIEPARLDGLLQIRGVLQTGNSDNETIRTAPLTDIPALLDSLAKARVEEGIRLAAVLDEILTTISDLVHQAKSLALQQPERIANRYKEAITNLIGETANVPEERIIQEAATLAIKVDVTEELDRLTAHVAQAREMISAGGAIGRRLDFLCQEFNREANTLGSKSADLSLTRLAMDLKTAIDAFREQAQNVE